MTYKEIIEKIEPEMEKSLNFLNKELSKIKIGRVSPSLIEDIKVEYHEEKIPLKQVASISVSGPRTIFIQPWDKLITLNIEKAILSTDLGLNPIVEGDLVKIVFAPPTEEDRKNLERSLKEKIESTRVSVRKWREQAWRQIQDEFRQGNIREDDKFKAKDELQKLIDDYNKKIEEMAEKKKKEIEL